MGTFCLYFPFTYCYRLQKHANYAILLIVWIYPLTSFWISPNKSELTRLFIKTCHFFILILRWTRRAIQIEWHYDYEIQSITSDYVIGDTDEWNNYRMITTVKNNDTIITLIVIVMKYLCSFVIQITNKF